METQSNPALDRWTGEAFWGNNTELAGRLWRGYPWGGLEGSEQGGLGLGSAAGSMHQEEDELTGPWKGTWGPVGAIVKKLELIFTCNGESPVSRKMTWYGL